MCVSNNESEIPPVMGKLLDGKRRSGQRIQRDDIFQKANTLSFQGLTASFAIQQGVFSTM